MCYENIEGYSIMALNKGKLLACFTLIAGAIVYIDGLRQINKLSSNEKFWPGKGPKKK